jgi:hypothetical protein
MNPLQVNLDHKHKAARNSHNQIDREEQRLARHHQLLHKLGLSSNSNRDLPKVKQVLNSDQVLGQQLRQLLNELSFY